MPINEIRALMVVLIPTGKFTKEFLRSKRELTEEKIDYLIDEEYIMPCGCNTANEILYTVTQKGKAI